MVDHVIPESEMVSLLFGSYEQTIALLQAGLKGIEIFGEDVGVKVVATYRGYAKVVSEDGRFARVKYSIDLRNGDVSCLGSELFDVKTVVEEETDLILESANSAVKSLQAGSVSEALSHIRPVLSDIGELHRVSNPEVVEHLFAHFDSNREWVKYLNKHKGEVEKLLEHELSSGISNRFQLLYESPSTKVELLRSQVVSALNKLRDRYVEIREYVESTVSEGNVAVGGNNELFSTVLLAKYLGEEVKLVYERLQVVRQRISDVRTLARVHDLVAGDLHLLEDAVALLTITNKDN